MMGVTCNKSFSILGCCVLRDILCSDYDDYAFESLNFITREFEKSIGQH